MTDSARPSRPELLLGSALGRQVVAGYVGYGPSTSLGEALFERLGLGPVPGTAALGTQKARTARPYVGWQDVPQELAALIVGYAVGWRSWREVLASATEADLLADLCGDTFGFGFDGEAEALWGLTAAAVNELRPVAEALASSPGARRWWEPVNLADQRFVEWDGERRMTGAELEQAVRACMAEERAENAEGLRRPRPPERPGVRIGALWWSAPGFAPWSWTTPEFAGLPAIGLCQFADTFLPMEDVAGATVWSLSISPQARICEINGPADWQELVARFPRDVTGTHDGEWRYWGGVPGPWRLPDWEQVMEHYDGVHVSIGGAVASGGLALPVGDAYTMLTGWPPGATLWLRDMATSVRRAGRWNGGAQCGQWTATPPEWTPDQSGIAGRSEQTRRAR